MITQSLLHLLVQYSALPDTPNPQPIGDILID
jgi:hypothetical protein